MEQGGVVVGVDVWSSSVDHSVGSATPFTADAPSFEHELCFDAGYDVEGGRSRARIPEVHTRHTHDNTGFRTRPGVAIVGASSSRNNTRPRDAKA